MTRISLSIQRRKVLDEAYRRSEYRVSFGNSLVCLQVGYFNGTADRQLRDAGVRYNWAIVTACNPYSEQVSAEINRATEKDLRRVIKEHRLKSFRSLNHDPDGHWPGEAGFLLCDPEAGLSEALGRRFQQNAIVTGALGDAPRLVWLDAIRFERNQTR